MPSVPVAPLVRKHVKGVKKQNVKHLLLSWTLGGYPGLNLTSAAEYFYEKCEKPREDRCTKAAQKIFSKALKQFPFSVDVLYKGPQNAGPSTLLYLKETGYKATMTCFAYDDLDSWRGVYSEEVFENQFEKICVAFEKGLLMLKDSESETYVMGKASWCLFKSSLNQIRFIRARKIGDTLTMKAVAENEITVAKEMLCLMNKNAAIGYEAANHYYFSKGQMVEKIINCNHIIKSLNLGE